MLTKISTITFDGKTKEDYDAIVTRLELEAPKVQGWELRKEPLINRVTAVKKEEITSL